MIERTAARQDEAESRSEKSGADCVHEESRMKHGEDGASSQVHAGPNPAGGEEASAAGPSDQGGSFDCNICLELAQDPVVTLCGHLFCWPCLYRWLQMHSICQECPVCKASVEEEKVIPLYGRGKVNCVDPRTKAVPGLNIPQRPSGQRPETARQAEQHYHNTGFNFMAGPTGPAATARFGNITLSAGFGLFPSLFGFQLHGFPDTSGLGGGPGIHLGTAGGLAGSHIHPTPPTSPDQQQEALLSRLLLLLGVFVIVCLLLF
jgi:E3 ubiquitin-protein ligase RNF5